MRQKLLLYLWNLVFFVSMISSASAITRQADIGIMENALRALASPCFSGHFQVEGVSLASYGVLFRIVFNNVSENVLTEDDSFSQIYARKQALDSKMAAVRGEHQALREKMRQARLAMPQSAANKPVKPDSGKKASALSMPFSLDSEALKQAVQVFFTDYLPSMQTVGQGEKAAVLVNGASFQLAWVEFEDVLAYKSRQISEAVLKERIQFDETALFPEIESAGHSVLSERLKKDEMTGGVYLKHYGALFFLPVGIGGKADFSAKDDLSVYDDPTVESTALNSVDFRRMLPGLIGVMGRSDAGQGLRDDEWIGFYLNQNNAGGLPPGHPGRMMMIQLRQGDLRQYQTGQIGVDMLRQRARVHGF